MANSSHISHSPEDTWRIAEELAASLNGTGILALHGDLGAGKTCFVHGLAQALGIDQPITSPTFTIVNEYQGDDPLYHIDLYRLSGPQEILDLGFAMYLETPGITAIEWAERAAEILPESTVHVQLEIGEHPSERRITIER